VDTCIAPLGLALRPIPALYRIIRTISSGYIKP